MPTEISTIEDWKRDLHLDDPRNAVTPPPAVRARSRCDPLIPAAIAGVMRSDLWTRQKL